jgi:hypothetical protein
VTTENTSFNENLKLPDTSTGKPDMDICDNVRKIGRFVMIKLPPPTWNDAPYDPPVNTTTQRSLLSVELEKSSVRKTEINPEETNADAIVSEDVCTLTFPVPDPIVNPLIVIVNADAPIVAPDVVSTTDVAVVAPHVNVSTVSLLTAPDATTGVIDEAKKPKG